MPTALATAALLASLCGLVLSVRRDPRALRNVRWGTAVVLCAAALALIASGGPSGVRGRTLTLLLVSAPALLALPMVLALVNGVAMLVREGPRPPHLLALAAGLGLAAVEVLLVVAAVDRHTPSVGAALAATIGAAGAGLELAAYIAYGCAYAWWIAPRTRPRVTHVVVLGAGLRDGVRVSPLLARRVRRGIAEWEAQGREPLIVMSGGQGSDEQVPEAVAMARYAAQLGVPEASLLLEQESTSTEENLRFSDRLMGPDARPVVVTSNFHALRAADHARRVGLDAHAVGATTAWYHWPTAMLREFGANVVRRPLGYVLPWVAAMVAGPWWLMRP